MRIAPSSDLVAQLDAEIRRGRFRSRAEGVREGIAWVLKRHREQEIEAKYRDAYELQPQGELHVEPGDERRRDLRLSLSGLDAGLRWSLRPGERIVIRIDLM